MLDPLPSSSPMENSKNDARTSSLAPSIADILAETTHRHHSLLPASHRPQRRTDASSTQEWTPLASLCLTHPSRPFEPVLVALGAGSKVVPTCRRRGGGKEVWDLHAEMLAGRGGRRWLLDEVIRAMANGESRWIERKGQDEMYEGKGIVGKWRLKEGVQIHLYISTLPCT